MRYLTPFLHGVREFRLSLTRHYDDHVSAEAYDLGREWAHRLTFRRFEEGV
jgi:hypothetical protein